MIQYVADEAHFQEVIARVANVKEHLWIGTADIKDLYVGERPLLGVLADLISKGREIRLIHAKEPGPKFREDFNNPDNSAICHRFDYIKKTFEDIMSHFNRKHIVI